MIASFTGYAVNGVATNGDPRFVQTFATPAGETGQINLSVLTQAGVAYDLTGAQVLLTVYRNGSTVLSRQATINAPSTGGTCFFPLVIADTLTLAPLYATGYTWDVWVTDFAGNRYQVIPVSQFNVLIARGTPAQPVTVPTSQIPLAQGPPGLAFNYTFQSSAYSAHFLDQIVGDPTTGSFTVTLPLISTLQTGQSGIVSIAHGSLSTNSITIVTSGSDKLLLAGSLVTSLVLASGENARLNPDVDGTRGNRWLNW